MGNRAYRACFAPLVLWEYTTPFFYSLMFDVTPSDNEEYSLRRNMDDQWMTISMNITVAVVLTIHISSSVSLHFFSKRSCSPRPSSRVEQAGCPWAIEDIEEPWQIMNIFMVLFMADCAFMVQKPKSSYELYNGSYSLILFGRHMDVSEFLGFLKSPNPRQALWHLRWQLRSEKSVGLESGEDFADLHKTISIY